MQKLHSYASVGGLGKRKLQVKKPRPASALQHNAKLGLMAAPTAP